MQTWELIQKYKIFVDIIGVVCRLASPTVTQTWTRVSPTLLGTIFPHQTCNFDAEPNIQLKNESELRSHDFFRNDTANGQRYPSQVMVNNVAMKKIIHRYAAMYLTIAFE